eukprot:gene102-gene273
MRSRANGPSNNEVEILSTEEQQKVIDELKTEASQQSGFFRNVFFVIFMGVAIAFLVCLGYSFVQPWSLMHQQHFKDKIPHAAFLLYYALSAYCFIVAGLLVKDPTHSTLIQINRYSGYGVGLIIFLGWSHIFHKHSVTNPILFWLPIADLAGLLLAQYVDFDSLNLVESMDGLENYRYEHKS